MNETPNNFQSRWGHHPCDRELHRKLKYLHRCYWQTIYDFHRWRRWWRKEPQNRVGPEPAFCPQFVEDRVWWKPVRVRGEDGVKVYPKTVIDHGVADLYRRARTPNPEPVERFDSATREKIEALHQEVVSQASK